MLSKAGVSGGELTINERPQVLKKVQGTHTLRGQMERPRQAAGTESYRQREQQDLGHRPLFASVVECFGIPWLRPDWSIQTKKIWVLASFVGVSLRGTQGESPGRQGRLFTQGLL